MALHLRQSMKLMLAVCISRGTVLFFKSENKRGGSESEKSKSDRGREIMGVCRDLSQLVLTDFCYVYRAQQNVAETIMELPVKYVSG